MDYCERCKDDVVEGDIYELHIDNGENGSEFLCRHCFEKATGTGGYDPENRDWDAVREEREFDGDWL